ncbi:prepilin-type N-terminal cleavage/methylation domain-containing protein [Candidatus Microgenomates bacterium]|nr:prepilin-type N-terminal cleavage/methylation domain-containing protein [Candidatus Microgenomates bacterium]
MKKQKKSAGFALIEIMIGIAVVSAALGMVGAARQKREIVRRQLQTSIEQGAQVRTEIEEITKVVPTQEPQTEAEKKTAATPRKEPETDTKEDRRAKKIQESEEFVVSKRESEESDADKRDKEKAEGKRPQTSSGSKDSGLDYDPNWELTQQRQLLDQPYSWYEQQQQEGTAAYYQQQQEAQQRLNEQYYYYEQQQQQQVFDPNQFMQNPYEQYNPALQDLYQQALPDVYQQFFP